jgi:hypothetical protein
LQYLNNSLPLPSLKNGKMGKKREKNIFFSNYLPDNKKGLLLHPLTESRRTPLIKNSTVRQSKERRKTSKESS